MISLDDLNLTNIKVDKEILSTNDILNIVRKIEKQSIEAEKFSITLQDKLKHGLDDLDGALNNMNVYSQTMKRNETILADLIESAKIFSNDKDKIFKELSEANTKLKNTKDEVRKTVADILVSVDTRVSKIDNDMNLNVSNIKSNFKTFSLISIASILTVSAIIFYSFTKVSNANNTSKILLTKTIQSQNELEAKINQTDLTKYIHKDFYLEQMQKFNEQTKQLAANQILMANYIKQLEKRNDELKTVENKPKSSIKEIIQVKHQVIEKEPKKEQLNKDIDNSNLYTQNEDPNIGTPITYEVLKKMGLMKLSKKEIKVLDSKELINSY